MIRFVFGRYGRPASRARRVADAWPLWAVLFCGLAVSARAQTNSDLPFDPVGKTCYLQVNVWHDAQNRIATLNLSEGERIAMGVKVVIRAFDAERIVFAIENKGEFTMERDKYGARLPMAEFFRRCFALDDPLAPDAPIHRLDKSEQRHIADGTLALGMSRGAVLMAVGYPPPHRTPDLQSNTWSYWISRWRAYRVTFDENGRVSDLRGYPQD
jgi:hypothetical protein